MSQNIFVRSETGVGDAIMLTGVLKSLESVFPNAEFSVGITENQSSVLMGRLRKNNPNGGKGLIDRILGNDYVPSSREISVNLQGYITRNAALKGDMTYMQAQIQLAENKLRDFGYDVSLPRDSIPEISFDNVPEFAREVEIGRKKLDELKGKYGNKPIVVVGASSAGSANRMPQSYNPNFWEELKEILKEEVILYELHGKTRELSPEVAEPKKDESYSLAVQSEIIKGSSAGIFVSGMHIPFSYALGKQKMVILIGPTHPEAEIYKTDGNSILTVPDASLKLEGCRGCGMVGYDNPLSFAEKRDIMRKRFPGFEFDEMTRRAIAENNPDAINKSPMCRELKTGERSYDCWSYVSPSEVAKKLESLLH